MLRILTDALWLGLFTWVCTIIGGLAVFWRGAVKYDALFSGFAAGMMTAAAIWSLMLPALESGGVIVSATGFLCGGLIFMVIGRQKNDRNFMLITSITIHNIPEGLAVGIGGPLTALAIGIQNIPEGAAVALPLAEEKGRRRAFLFAVASGAVEPVFAVVGAGAARVSELVLPYALSFAAGAMFFVVMGELMPKKASPVAAVFGFAVMLLLDAL